MKILIRQSLIPALLIILAIMLYACGEDVVPKPRGYFRLDMPDREYVKFDTTFPYTFEYPVYSQVKPDPYSPDEPYWMNMEFPGFKGTLHISYKNVNDSNLAGYLEDSRKFVIKHIPKASAIYDSLILDRDREIYGMIYEIQGSAAASPFQFFITDSTQHFVRGALYFNIVPNNDSLQPVIQFLKADIHHLLKTFDWK